MTETGTLSAAEAAALADVSKAVVWRCWREGEIRAYRDMHARGRPLVVLDPDHAVEVLKSHKRQPTPLPDAAELFELYIEAGSAAKLGRELHADPNRIIAKLRNAGHEITRSAAMRRENARRRKAKEARMRASAEVRYHVAKIMWLAGRGKEVPRGYAPTDFLEGFDV